MRCAGRGPPRRAETLKIDDKPIAQTLGGADWKRVDKAGKVLFSIKSQNQKIYEDGRNVFAQATLTMPDCDGRTITITSDEAESTKPPEGTTDFATANVRGHVKLRTSDDLAADLQRRVVQRQGRHDAGARAGDVHPRPA